MQLLSYFKNKINIASLSKTQHFNFYTALWLFGELSLIADLGVVEVERGGGESFCDEEDALDLALLSS